MQPLQPLKGLLTFLKGMTIGYLMTKIFKYDFIYDMLYAMQCYTGIIGKFYLISGSRSGSPISSLSS